MEGWVGVVISDWKVRLEQSWLGWRGDQVRIDLKYNT